MVTSILQWIGGYIRGVRYTPAAGLMLNEKELAFIKAICTLKLSPTFLRDLRKGVAAKKRKAFAHSKAKTTRVVPTPSTIPPFSERKKGKPMSVRPQKALRAREQTPGARSDF